MRTLRNFILAGTLAAMAVTTSSPALAHGFDRGRGGDTTGAAIAGGIVGLAVGAAIASSGRNRDFYDGPRYPRYRAYYVYRDYPPRWHRNWDRRWDRRYWGPRGWDRGYLRYRGWDGPHRW